MQIDSSILSEFFKKITLDNKIPTAKLVGVVDGITTKLKLMDVINVRGWLSEKAFHKFEQIEIEIRNSEKFNHMLKGFKGKLSINVDGNFIKMYNDNKTAFFKRASQIDNYTENVVKVLFDSGINLTSAFIKEILSNISVTEAEYIMFEVLDNVLLVTTVGNEDKVIEQINVNYKNSKFGMSAEYFKTIFTSLENDKINISFQDIELLDKNPPCKITDKGDTYCIEVWCAPFNPE